MLSKHPEMCRFPHGHTRQVDVVVSSEKLDANDMVLDFKALKLAVQDHIESYDHRMAINANDPLLEQIKAVHPDSLVVFPVDPTTEVMAKEIFDFISKTLQIGFEGVSSNGISYVIAPGSVTLERVRVSETPSSWAEYGK